MANKKAARKSITQIISRTARNRVVCSKLKTLSKKAFALADAGSSEAKNAAFHYISELDKAVKKNVIHRNAANRKKSSLSKEIFGQVQVI
ncbi:MAG: 30S ribosomal protein S20 [Puniceicoccales bacterium]|nr:30S ribosomal protein S20 [Puniceicoccales bacterium]